MKKMLLLAAIVLFVYFSCSPDKTSPSSKLIQYYDARQSADVQKLKKLLSKEAYMEEIRRALPLMEGSGKVFEYDMTHFATNPESLRRMDIRLQEVLIKQKQNSRPKIAGQDALAEKKRLLHYQYGSESQSAEVHFMGGEWKIVRFSRP